MSLRSRHADLLVLPVDGGLASTDTGKRRNTTAGQSEAPGPAARSATLRKPLRLVTNGLWPVLAATTTGGANDHIISSVRRRPLETVAGRDDDLAAAQGSSSTSMKTAGGERPAGSNGDAAVLANELAQLFDSVSVALNTADPAQYEQASV